MNSFITKINEVRDILRKDGITGMESITHCVAFYILRNLTNELCIKLDIDDKYNYDKFNKDVDGTTFLCKDKLFEKFYKQGSTECFVYVLVNKFKFKPIKQFAIKTSLYLEKIFKCFETINTEQLNMNYDIVGAIYEIHLSTGSTGQGMRDLGQYFTHRRVIKYMVELCNPKVKPNGLIETILDPAMGTGGFLTMATKYLNTHNTNINWSQNQSNIYGFDISDNVQSLAYINLLLENNEIFENIRIQDTLHGDYKINDTIIDKYDVILANEPFGLKNIVHAECCRRIVNLKIRGTKAEPLFLQLMMISLNQNGRCAVIVPDGVLFNDAKLHKDTRKYLIDNLNLKKVIGMEGEFFMNTGVKSSILYFVNDGTTENVDFCKIKLINNEIIEETIKTVTKDIIVSKDYSLFINKYIQSNIVQLNNVEYKKIGDMCVFLPKSKRPASFGTDTGLYPFYTSSMTSKLCDIVDYHEELIILGDGGCANINISNNFSCSDHNYLFKTLNNNYILNKYIYYYLYKNINLIENGFKGTAIKNVAKNYIQEIQIPVPSLEIQNQIITVLNNDYLIIKNASELIKMYEEKKKGIVWSNTINTRIEKIGDMCVFLPKSKRPASFGTDTGLYPFYTSSMISKLCDIADYNEESIIIGTGGNASIKISLHYSCSADNFIIKVTNENTKYIYYWLIKNINKIEELFHGTTIKHLSKTDLETIEIPVPSLEVQQDIVKQCEHYDNLINTLKKQIEDIEKENIIVKVLQSLHTV